MAVFWDLELMSRFLSESSTVSCTTATGDPKPILQSSIENLKNIWVFWTVALTWKSLWSIECHERSIRSNKIAPKETPSWIYTENLKAHENYGVNQTRGYVCTPELIIYQKVTKVGLIIFWQLTSAKWIRNFLIACMQVANRTQRCTIITLMKVSAQFTSFPWSCVVKHGCIQSKMIFNFRCNITDATHRW